MRKKRWIAAGVALAAAALLAGALLATGNVRQAPTMTSPPASDALTQASADLDTYEVKAVLDEATRTLTCTQRVTYENRTGGELNEICFHLYPNAFKRVNTSPAVLAGVDEADDSWQAGEIWIEDVRVDGEAADWAVLGEDEAALRVCAPLAAGERAGIELRYTLSVPALAYRWGEADGVISVANAFPIAAMYEDGAWRLDEYGPIGDPFYSACANWTLTLTVPEGFMVASAGAIRESRTEAGVTTLRIEAPAVRDVAFAMSRRYACAQQMAGDVLVSSYALRQKDAQAALEYAVSALAQFEAMLVDYPYPSLTVAQKDLGGYGGMEYSGFALIDGSLYEGDRQLLERVVAHETAHQYFGILVGSDQIEEPWLDEALCEYMTMMYIDKEYGRQAFNALYEQSVEPALRISHPVGVTAGSPITNFLTAAEYGQCVYQKGAGMLHGIREALGEAAFLSALRDYIDAYAYGIASREDFTLSLQASTGLSWRGFIDDYLDE